MFLLCLLMLHRANCICFPTEPWKAAQRLLAVCELVNQAIGDALSVLLLVEVVLQYMGWSVQEWNSIYTDLPSRQLKVTQIVRIHNLHIILSRRDHASW